MVTQIKYVIETVGSKVDINGNRRFFVNIFSTKTGKHFSFLANGQFVGIMSVQIKGKCRHENYLDFSVTLPIREFNRYAKEIKFKEHEITEEMFDEINRYISLDIK